MHKGIASVQLQKRIALVLDQKGPDWIQGRVLSWFEISCTLSDCKKVTCTGLFLQQCWTCSINTVLLLFYNINRMCITLEIPGQWEAASKLFASGSTALEQHQIHQLHGHHANPLNDGGSRGKVFAHISSSDSFWPKRVWWSWHLNWFLNLPILLMCPWFWIVQRSDTNK